MAGWITMNGTHIYVKDGESVDEAFERQTGKSMQSANNDKVNANIRDAISSKKESSLSTKSNTENNTESKVKVENRYDDFKRMNDELNKEMSSDASIYEMDKTRAEKLYPKFQDGSANKDNFFNSTFAEFEKMDSHPDREPDYVSKDRNGRISSKYWYTDEGVYRESNHWGHGVASCNWYMKGARSNNSDSASVHVYGKKIVGFSKWDGFTHKTSPIYLNGKKYISTFNNTLSRGRVVIEGKKYAYNDWTMQYYEIS